MKFPVRLSGLELLAVVSSAGVLLAALYEPRLTVLLSACNVVVVALVATLRAGELDSKRAARGGAGVGAYEILDKLGEGGMGEVYRARQVGLSRMVALKTIKPLQASEEDRARFRQEARVLSALFNPHTINVFDAGIRRDGSFYYVMELLHGRNLEQVVSAQGAIHPARVIHILRQATMSLAEAHQCGLVHRDLKPANLMVCRYGGEHDFVKVLDFGLVKVGRPDTDFGGPISEDHAVPGTPAFMAPETLLGSGFVDHRADIYSLGALGHYLLTGHYLFDEDTPLAMARAQLHQPPVRASTSSPLEVPARLDELLFQCLQKDPKARPQSAEELLRELEQLGLAHPWTREQAAACFRDLPRPSLRPAPALPSELEAS